MKKTQYFMTRDAQTDDMTWTSERSMSGYRTLLGSHSYHVCNTIPINLKQRLNVKIQVEIVKWCKFYFHFLIYSVYKKLKSVSSNAFDFSSIKSLKLNK